MLNLIENESAFDKWVTTKNLDEGVKILARLNKEAGTRIDDIIFAAVAIDSASQGCGSESKTMKSALRSYMIKNYTYKDLRIDKDVYSKFSKHAMKVYVRKVQNPKEEIFSLYSCSFVKSTNGSDMDQKLLNSIFLKEVNRQWGNAMNKLNRKLQSEFGSKIECSQPKLDKDQGMYTNARDAKSKDLDYKNYSSEAKSSRRDYCNIASSLFISEAKNAKLPDNSKKYHRPLTVQSYKIPNRQFVRDVSLALQTLKDIENEIKNEESKKRIKEIEIKEAESKATHENWVKEKMRIARDKRRMESTKLKKEAQSSMFEPIFSANAARSSKKISQADEDNSEYSDDSTIVSIEPVMPKIWAEETEGTNNKMITIYWESEDDNVKFYILSLYDKKGKSPYMHWRDPSRDEDEREMKKLFSLPPGDYWFGITATSFQGSSPQARIQILSKAIMPGHPTLSKASDTCLDIKWSDNREILSSRQEGNCVPPIDKNNRDFSYVVEQGTNDDTWEELWVGSTNFASISGLLPDETYRLRVYVRGRNDNLSSPYGEAKIYHTLPRSPNSLQIAPTVDKVDPIGKHYTILCWEYLQPLKSNKKQSHQWLRQILPDNILMSEWKHISNALGIPDLSEQEKEQLSSTASIGINEFLKLWSTHLNFVVYQSTDERTSHRDVLNTGKIVFHGVENTVKVNGLIPDSTYTFRLQCKTLRGQSALSPPLVIHTKPESPNAVLIVHLGSNEVILNILKPHFGGKVLVEMKLKQSNTNDSQWKKTYIGRQSIVKVPNLRPSKEYEIRARLLNKVGEPGACISRSIQTLDKPYIVDSTTILSLFPIDCIDIVEGDLILFSDTDERTVVARIISLNTKVTMEIVWTSDKAPFEVPGTVIERDLPALRKYEVLRTPWIDERGRCLKE